LDDDDDDDDDDGGWNNAVGENCILQKFLTCAVAQIKLE
jgi:hypothetical protein